MRVAVNARFLLAGRLEGIGRFSHETLSRLVKAKPDWEFIFIFDRPYDKQFIYGPNVIPVVVSPQARHPILFWWWFEVALPRVFKKYKADIFFSPDGYLSLKSNIPQIPVFHDLAFEHYPEGVSKVNLWHYKYFFPRYAKKAANILAVSQATAIDIQNLYHIKSDKIKLINNAASDIFKPLDALQISETKQKYTNGNPYFLYVGAIHPRKNLANLLLAFEYYHEQNPNSVFKLVIAGRKAWKNKLIDELYHTLACKRHIIFTGRLDDIELAKVTGSATALCYMSLFEGFGIPIIEAMQCGVPVITSNISSMPEVAGGAALLANPLSPTEIYRCMQKLSSNVVGEGAKPQTQEFIQKGFENAKRYTWNGSVEGIIEVLSNG
ncbi:MAG: glycosyltransferase family 1 protein [Bacteroidota bacterium]|nr:glycosyltransferase family 1 protein [Bacteroidota bacterium]